MTCEKSALIEHEKTFLLSCWLPSGTFRLSPMREQINPYFTNLALLALIPLNEWEPIQSHIEWYFRHLNHDGFVNDYHLEGQAEIDTGTADSEDSYHATLFSLVSEWIRATDELAGNQAYRISNTSARYRQPPTKGRIDLGKALLPSQVFNGQL